ncbi:MAG: hypothetical protein E7369_05060 [Clostridiales bacterium]|nr:hypothetical protein [Clostridiales bacterium]
MKKVIGLGACVYDTLISCPNYPKEDIKLKADSVCISGGGPVGNSLVIMSKCGVDVGVIGLFADDNAGKYLLDDFNKYNVSTKNSVVVKNTNSFTSYILLSQDTNTRTCVFDRGTVPDDCSLVDYSPLKDADVLHLDGNYLNCAIKACQIAKANNVKTSLDAGGLYKDIDKLLPYIDILIPSAEFAMGITKTTDIVSAMQLLKYTYNPEILVVTDGKNGGYYMKGDDFIHYDSFKVNALDTNGAGDTFHGAFLTAYLDGKSVEDCCKFASATSAYKCKHKGVRTFELNKDIIEIFSTGKLNAKV